MLWVGERLSALERLAIASWLANGHAVDLFTYGPLAGVPDGATVRDAGEILPPTEVFTYSTGFGKGSVAVFANLFRYKLLLERGGAWSDTDTVCLKPMAFLDGMEHAISSERVAPGYEVDGRATRANVGLIKAPKDSALMAACHAAASAARRGELQWGETGPTLIDAKVAELGFEPCVLQPDAVCPVDWWNIAPLFDGPVPDRPRTYAIHMWNAIWRHNGLDKDGIYPREGAFETLKRRYGIEPRAA